MKRTLLVNLFMAITIPAAAEDFAASYEAAAKKEKPTFSATAEAGRAFFLQERKHSKGDTVSCALCHTKDPKAVGRTRANKDIEPLAPVANPKRFTDRAKIEKWFLRNCNDVLERQCTAEEKAIFIKYLFSVK